MKSCLIKIIFLRSPQSSVLVEHAWTDEGEKDEIYVTDIVIESP